MWGPNIGPLLFLSPFFSFLLSPFSIFLPPLTLFNFFFTWLFFFISPFLLQKKKNTFLNFSTFLHSSPLIFFLDPCVFEHFCYTPIFGKTPFSNPSFLCIKMSSSSNRPSFLTSHGKKYQPSFECNDEEGLLQDLKTHAPNSHMDIKVSFSFGFFVWQNVASCFIESLMVRHCHFIVWSCWNLGHCMIDHVVILALEHFGSVVFLVMV